jgi:enoyl-CoA hydratase
VAEFLRENQRGRVLRITLDRPEKRNAMDAQMEADLFGRIHSAMQDQGTRVVVLAGTGKSFCSGADLKPTRPPPGATAPASVTDAAGDMTRNRGRVDQWLRLWSAPKPLIAQVHGHCIGIANELVACCDLVVCGQSARFGMPEAREFALPPTLAFWPLRIGLARTKELLFTGRFMDGAEAVAVGMANQVVPDAELEAAVDALAAQIAEVDPAILAVSKQAANAWAETFGVRQAALGGAEYHAIYHQASTYEQKISSD